MDRREPRVLVAYGSKYGSTAEIADRIGDVLSKSGCATAVCPAREAVQDVSAYDAVVLGGALYAGHWHRDARRFARRARRALGSRPVWLFSSGPLDPSAAERDIPPVPGVRRIADRLDANGHITFGGRLDEHARGRMARMLVDSGKGGDFRDIAQITGWAERIARELLAARGGERATGDATDVMDVTDVTEGE
ncbi:flavodoxin domain-containing protein [Streptomyces sp. VRA16 Mangrove soil]|uniref:flavodoxin domain-containing protein n=1 Tax=Streptomyces sp. VRA16 Mangrove soil TaxID=2817434 RepID=UPI001A9FB807|nr:flavodoxin domain-containing protein [Streptomyces sp. VRA16 Mangrove soil]MBO1334413.1 flavodoxin [Streptomyces sp. VRA16 Mangrove soil]